MVTKTETKTKGSKKKSSLDNAKYVIDVGVFESGFVYVKTKIDGRTTNVSIDILLGAMMVSILGTQEAMRNWVAGRAAVLAHGNEPFLENGQKKKRVGLSRLVQREILRFIALPAKQDFDYLRKINRIHPLDPSLVHSKPVPVVSRQSKEQISSVANAVETPVDAKPVETVSATELDNYTD